MRPDRLSDAQPLTRRGFLKTAAFVVGYSHTFGAGAEQGVEKTFRFVHLADIHLFSERRAPQGFRKCLEVVHELKPRPDFILTGGDLVMDVMEASEDGAKKQFDLYTSMCADSDIPIRQCIGNHDVFGWGNKSGIKPDHVSYGKKMVQERLELPRTTYSFDHKGWHFCVVDDILPKEGGYRGGFSQKDLDWLDRDLTAAADKPCLVCTHIPVITKRSAPCYNAEQILGLLKKHQVELVLVGHVHENERFHRDKTLHISEGAVSGNKWGGWRNGHPEGFGILDMHSDGTFKHRYQAFGWKAQQQPASQPVG